jgi:poly-gamma-glutamate synthesis protein (capsule biosynthesis protein)
MTTKITKIYLLIFAPFLLFSGCAYDFSSFNHRLATTSVKTDQTAPKNISSSTSKTKKQKNTETSTVTLAAVGDILIHDTVYRDAQVTSSYNFRPMFRQVRGEISSADIAFANQESMIGGEELGLSSYPQFNSPYGLADDLKWAEFDIVNLANNHTLDQGEQGIKNATNYLDKIGLKYIGAARSASSSKKIKIIEKKDIKLSFLGYTYGTNGIPVPRGKDYLVNLIDQKQIQQDIAKAEKKSDLTVVSLHFGTQYQKQPNQIQKNLAKKLNQAGADIILGHHPHVLQPIEWVESENNKTLVAYSLGNFLSGQIGLERNIGGILKVDINKKDKKTTIGKVSFIPTWVKSNKRSNFEIIPLKEADKFGLDHAKKKYQETMKHVLGEINS